MKKFQYNKGFTLVEMIVSLGIFTIVALVAVSALIKIMDANKKSIALKTAINNMNFTLESISREMRVGSNYSCNSVTGDSNNNLTPIDCDINTNNPDWVIAFNSSKPYAWKAPKTGNCRLIYAYKYTAGDSNTRATLQKAQQKDCETAIDPSQDFQNRDIISSEVNIDKSIVSVKSTGQQPYVTLFFHGSSGARVREQAEFSVQTSVSQRLPK